MSFAVAVHVMLIRDKQIFLMRRHGTHWANDFSLVGGSVEQNETLQQAILREAREEVGIHREPP